MADDPTTKTRQPKANISAEALQAMVASMNEMRAMVEKYKAEAEAATKAMSNAKPAANGKTPKQVQSEIQVLRAFKKAGFGTVTPHINVKTFNRWIAEGRRPTEGSKSVKAGGLRLFHLSQTRELSKESLAVREDQPKAAEVRKAKSAKVVPIGAGAPHQ